VTCFTPQIYSVLLKNYEEIEVRECLLLFGAKPLSTRLLSNKIILPFALYGCETWSCTMEEEHRLKVLENMALRKIFGPNKEEVTVD
jgi:hypothetical protein